MGQKKPGRPASRLIIGAARPEHVIEHCRAEEIPHTVLWSRAQIPQCASLPHIPLSGKFSRWNLRQFLQYKSLKPERVDVVCGPEFWHGNVLDALELWNILLNIRPGISVWHGARKDSHHLSNHILRRSIRRRELGMLFAPLTAVLALLALAGSLGGPYWALFALLALVAVEGLSALSMAVRGNVFENYARYTPAILRTESSPRIRYDKELGWAPAENCMSEGTIRLVNEKAVLKFTSTHTAEGSRITSAISRPEGNRKIIILGCSVSYGSALSDRQTYAYNLQSSLEDHTVINLAVEGYSLYQILLRLERHLSRSEAPEIALLAFHGSLPHRGIKGFNSHWYNLSANLNPSCKLRKGQLIRQKPDGYRRVPGAGRSLFLRGWELLHGRLHLGRACPKDEFAIGCHLLLAIQNLCRQHGIKLHVVVVYSSPQYYEFLWRRHFSWSICAADHMPFDQATLVPFDTHPNEMMNGIWHEHIMYLLERIKAGEMIRPDLAGVASSFSGKDSSSVREHLYQLF
jgi:hypothetical protein